MGGPTKVSTQQMDWSEHARGEVFGHRRKALTVPAGGERLGCSLYEVPPGRKAWPYHYHLGNEEAIFVLAGRGALRTASGEIDLAAGDYVTFPPGEGGGHQISNPSQAPLRYLCFSTMQEPDVTVYPDSGKLGVFAGAAPGGDRERRTLNKYLSLDAEVGYYDGEA